MKARALVVTTVLFFLVLIVTAFVSLLVLRMQGAERAGEHFQLVIPVAERFLKTFLPTDIPERESAAKALFSAAKISDAVAVEIRNKEDVRIFGWFSTPDHYYQYTNDTLGISVQTYVTSLPGAAVLSIAYNTLSMEYIRIVLILFILAVSLFAMIVLFLLALGSKSPVQSSPSQEHNELSDNPMLPNREASTTKRGKNIGHPIGQPEPEKIPETRDLPTPVAEPDSKFFLLDKKTGVTHGRFLLFRLEKELARSAENALDLSLVVVRFPGIAEKDRPLASSLVRNEFNHEDLIFEHDTEGFAIVLPQHDLDQAIARTEMLVRNSDQYLSTTAMRAGITSRNGRLVDAKRFLKEAAIALRRSVKEEGRIVGFRPDPVRFRHFLRHHRV